MENVADKQADGLANFLFINERFPNKYFLKIGVNDMGPNGQTIKEWNPFTSEWITTKDTTKTK